MAHELMAEYKFMTCTTKRHQTEGYGDRFRLVIPINYRLQLEPDDYKEFMQNILNWLPFAAPVDEASLQPEKKWETNPSGIVHYNDGDLLDVATGDLTGTWAEAASGPGSGSGFGAYPAGVGARFTWATSGIVAGRRVRGSTFLCPLVNSCFGTDGTLDETVRTALDAAADGLVTASAGAMRIWSRPAPGRPGQASAVTAGDVPDKVSWLRSRRT